jgi:hypothetical protein
MATNKIMGKIEDEIDHLCEHGASSSFSDVLGTGSVRKKSMESVEGLQTY